NAGPQGLIGHTDIDRKAFKMEANASRKTADRYAKSCGEWLRTKTRGICRGHRIIDVPCHVERLRTGGVEVSQSNIEPAQRGPLGADIPARRNAHDPRVRDR